MRIAIFLMFIVVQLKSQNLVRRSQEIRYETRRGAITPEKVGSLFEDLSKELLLLKNSNQKLQTKLDSLMRKPKSIPTKTQKTYHDLMGNEL